MRARLLTLLAVLALAGGLTAVVDGAVPAPAHARGQVTVANGTDGTATIDSTYATELTVRGTGFQSVRGGHGGVYVFFGTVSGSWRPSQGGASGADYLYVPDSESRDNQGYQSFLAFPGSDTSGSAQGQLSADGGWSTTITVPGAEFQAVGRNGASRTVDCRAVTCGIITIGAHGVVNANNETFTPVRVADLYDDAPADPGTTTDLGAEQPAEPADPAAVDRPVRLGPMKLEVDRASATAGHALSFTAGGLPPGTQVSAVLDDGVAAAGPFLVGEDGRATGVVTLPADLDPGTHELRIFGLGEDAKAPTVRFAVAAADQPAPAPAAAGSPEPVAAEADEEWADRLGPWFFGGAVVVLVLALVRVAVARRGRRA